MVFFQQGMDLLAVTPIHLGSQVGLTWWLAFMQLCKSGSIASTCTFRICICLFFLGDHGLNEPFSPSLLSKGANSRERREENPGHGTVKEQG